MRRVVAIGAVSVFGLLWGSPAAHAGRQTIAALQVALRAHGVYHGQIDGVPGPQTQAGLMAVQQKNGLRPTGRFSPALRRRLGWLGRPLLGQRELTVGKRGWDVASLEFRLISFGLSPRVVDGRFTEETAAALRRFQDEHGLRPDGIAGTFTFRALAATAPRIAPPPARVHVVEPGEGFIVIAERYHVSATALAAENGLTLASLLVPGQRLTLPGEAARPLPATGPITHVVKPGESWFSIAELYRVSPYELARVNGQRLDRVIVPDQRLRLPAGAEAGHLRAPGSRESVRESLDHWSSVYGVDPLLTRALAWMESGFQQDVVSDVGAIGVMQLLPETWAWVDADLIGKETPRTADGNVQAGVRYLRWQLDHFGGDVRLALAGWYQGARAVREIGFYDDTKQFVAVVLALYGTV
jgi:peptidoglycan hydrolase-like protein with peptidoglycan-binding domain